MKALLNWIRSQRRLYRFALLILDRVPGARATVRAWVGRATAPRPQPDAQPVGSDQATGSPAPSRASAGFAAEGYPALLAGENGSAPDTRPLITALNDKPAIVDYGPMHVVSGAVPPAKPSPQRTLLVDVSEICRFDLATGIQRVVRNVVARLIVSVPPGWRVEPVYEYQGRYYLARAWTHSLLGLTLPASERRWRPDAPANPQAGDVFLGLDWAPQMVISARDTLRQWRQQGVSVCFVIYDLLPLQMPRHFPKGFADEVRQWLHTITGLADGLFCISETVATDVRRWLARHQAGRLTDLKVAAFPLGADMQVANHSECPPEIAACDREEVATVLMVGALHPRKGYRQALEAMECLWQRGRAIRLVIVGSPGGRNAALVRRIRRHPRARQANPRLVWLQKASDTQLEWLYRNADVLLAASEGEGYGLPLLEAGMRGLPVLARDIPVFRETVGNSACFFDGEAPEALADALERWLASRHNSRPQGPVTWYSWQQSTDRLLKLIVSLDSVEARPAPD
jgi:glycosyltransferase involved in cell wall biosynthesis